MFAIKHPEPLAGLLGICHSSHRVRGPLLPADSCRLLFLPSNAKKQSSTWLQWMLD